MPMISTCLVGTQDIVTESGSSARGLDLFGRKLRSRDNTLEGSTRFVEDALCTMASLSFTLFRRPQL